MNWDDFRIFLEIAQTGGLKKAARNLGLHHTSCARRLSKLEADLGTVLFDRLPAGYSLTESGRELAQSMRIIKDEFNGIERGITGRDARLEGPIRLSLPNGFATHLLMPAITEFTELYPNVHLNLNMTYDFSDLANREADIAIRHADNPPQSLTGKRVALLHRSAYASVEYLANHDLVGKPEECHWLGWGEPSDHLKWPIKKRYPTIPIRGSMYSDVLQLAAAQAHMGVASLPCFIGDTAPDLKRIPNAEAVPTDWVWILAHQDMISNVRVQTLMQHLALAFETNRDVLEGIR